MINKWWCHFFFLLNKVNEWTFKQKVATLLHVVIYRIIYVSMCSEEKNKQTEDQRQDGSNILLRRNRKSTLFLISAPDIILWRSVFCEFGLYFCSKCSLFAGRLHKARIPVIPGDSSWMHSLAQFYLTVLLSVL